MRRSTATRELGGGGRLGSPALALPTLLALAALAALWLSGCDEQPASRDNGDGGGGDGTVWPGDGAPPVDGTVPPGDGSGPRPDQAGPGGCTVFPADNPWNTDISGLPVHPNSNAIVASIGASTGLHPDFGEGTNGIPYVVVDSSQPMVDINFTAYGDESDPGPYRIPLDAPIEDGLDRHAIAVDLEDCMLYELFDAYPRSNSWDAASGAKFNLKSNDLRPIGWTSADAAGLPIYPGLVRHDEVASGKITHALRFTAERTRRAFVLPATHWASSDSDPDLPAMGMRFRLKAGVDISGFSATNQVILRALKTYGMFMADNGGDWFVSGAPSPSWDDDDLHQLKLGIRGSDFEVVDTGPVRTSYD